MSEDTRDPMTPAGGTPTPGGGDDGAPPDGEWDAAQRLALLAMALTPLVLGVAVFLLLRQATG